jgi:hypothetical protein
MQFLLRYDARTILNKAGYILRPPVLVLAPGYKTAAAVLPAPILKLFKALGGKISS